MNRILIRLFHGFLLLAALYGQMASAAPAIAVLMGSECSAHPKMPTTVLLKGQHQVHSDTGKQCNHDHIRGYAKPVCLPFRWVRTIASGELRDVR